MSYLCPVCNGLSEIQATCPACGQIQDDQGKLQDFLGPYAPYRPIDEMKMTDGYDDLESRRCVHIVYCPRCSRSDVLFVHEWES